MSRDIRDAVYGCVIGGAIGDALGAPVEGWNWRDIRREHGRLEEFQPFDAGYAKGAGHVTDDTYLRHLLCMAIVRAGGRPTPDDFAAVLKEKMNPARLWVNEGLVLKKIRQGMNPWWETGRGAIPAGCATMMIAPVGIINAADPAQAYQDAFCIAGINQEGLNRTFAATFAAAVAAAFAPGATPGSVVETMLAHSDWLAYRYLATALEMARSCDRPEEFVEQFYSSHLIDLGWPSGQWDLSSPRYFSGNSREIVPAVAGIIHLCGDAPQEAIIEGANFGRDCDTIGSCCGSIVGAMHGASALRRDWIEQCEAANTDIFEELHGDGEENFAAMASHLTAGLLKERDRTQCRADELSELLGADEGGGLTEGAGGTHAPGGHEGNGTCQDAQGGPA